MTADVWESIKGYYDVYFGVNALYEKFAKEQGLTSSALFVLCVLYDHPQESTESMICAKLFYPKQTVNAILAAYEKQGYIQKTIQSADKRRKILGLTAAGQAYAQAIVTRMRCIEERAFAGMSPEARRWMRQGEQEFMRQLTLAMEADV